MGVTALRSPVGGWGPRLPSKVSFTGQLQYREQVSQMNQGEPPTPPPPPPP